MNGLRDEEEEQNRGFILYVNKYMRAIYTLIHGTPLPRVIPEMRHTLQLRKDARTRDWYLEEDHTIIRCMVLNKNHSSSLVS
jgi:hypothetical protein